MYLTRHATPAGPRWARDGRWLPAGFTLGFGLSLPSEQMLQLLAAMPVTGEALAELLAPVEPLHEIWAAGVTYRRSREAREAESSMADVYARVYEADRPELFFKASGWRVSGQAAPIHVRADSRWNVPEPELTLVINRYLEIVGYCAGDDVCSRTIEGENPLYLPQAKIYDQSCALGPGLELTAADPLVDLPVQLEITRQGKAVFQGEARTSQMKRDLAGLVAYLGRELAFPFGVFLMTGTGIVPPDDQTSLPGDRVRVTVGALTLVNDVR